MGGQKYWKKKCAPKTRNAWQEITAQAKLSPAHQLHSERRCAVDGISRRTEHYMCGYVRFKCNLLYLKQVFLVVYCFYWLTTWLDYIKKTMRDILPFHISMLTIWEIKVRLYPLKSYSFNFYRRISVFHVVFLVRNKSHIAQKSSAASSHIIISLQSPLNKWGYIAEKLNDRLANIPLFCLDLCHTHTHTSRSRRPIESRV